MTQETVIMQPLPNLSNIRWQTGVLLAATAMLLSVSALRADQEVNRTLPADPKAVIEIENVSGSIEIYGWDRDEVQVTGTIGDDVEELIVEGGPRSIVIEVEVPEGRRWGNRDLAADLEIKVPKGARLEVEGISSSIEVEDFSGRLEAESVSGSIEARGSLTSADLETVSGSIRLRGANTRTSAESVSGKIELEGVSDRVEASTVSGSIEIDAGTISRGDIESVSGTIRLQCALTASARLDVGSHSGNVTVELPADVSASFEATTFSGRIDNDFGPEAERDSRWVPSKSLEFETGSGDAEITLETFSGSLRIQRR